MGKEGNGAVQSLSEGGVSENNTLYSTEQITKNQ